MNFFLRNIKNNVIEMTEIYRIEIPLLWRGGKNSKNF